MAADELYGGRRSDAPDVDSLANALEQAFNDVRVNDFNLGPLPVKGRDERMMLFLGIARGIVAYLGAHEAAFGTSQQASHRHNVTIAVKTP